MIADATQVQMRQRYIERYNALKEERSSWLAHWQEIADYIFPRRFRYLHGDRNKGTKRNDKIVNSKPTICMRTLMNGMLSGQSSPTRPWIRFGPPSPELNDDYEVKIWLDEMERAFYQTCAKSNAYNGLHEMNGGEAAFATAAMYVEEDEQDDIRTYVFPIGQYVIACSSRQRVDTIFREFSMTVGQMKEAFGLANLSPQVQEKWKKGKLDEWIEVLHIVEPRRDRDPNAGDSKNMPFRSIWFEMSKITDTSWQKPLRESGYEEFPVMVGRWYVTGEDVYGSGSPGMEALGDCKALQLYERRKAQAVDKIINPPMKGAASLQKGRLSLLPGDTTYLPDHIADKGLSPAIEVHPATVTVADAAIREIERRIEDAFFTRLFMMMLEDEAQQPRTARDIDERHEEKMLQLGPTVERNQDEVFDPFVNRVCQILIRRGKVRPPPPQLGGRVKIEYISVMAQAQKILATSATDRFLRMVGSVSAVKKEILDIPNFDRLVRRYAENLGLAPDEVNPEEVVKQWRSQRAQEDQAAKMLEAEGVAAQNAKVMSETDMSSDSALSRLLSTVGGGGGPIGG
jgi:hypothetical protein